MLKKPFYLHYLDFSAFSRVEMLERFAVVLVYTSVSITDNQVLPQVRVSSVEPYAVAPGGVAGLPYLRGLAPAGTDIIAIYDAYFGRLLMVTESPLAPRFRDKTPPPVVFGGGGLFGGGRDG